MSSYQDFAYLYDGLTFDVEYEKMADFISRRLASHGITSGLVLDLACGTGTLTLALAGRGYDMTGADLSEEMLAVARQKEGSENILFLNQPMEDFELYGTMDAIVCVLDSVNYLTDPEALKKTFRLCANYLNPGGILIFDTNSPYKFRHLLGNETYTFETDDVFYVWENEWQEEEDLLHLYLTFFKEAEDGLYHRIDEVHTQRLYDDAFIKKTLAEAGLTLLARYDNYEDTAPSETTERIVYEVMKQEANH